MPLYQNYVNGLPAQIENLKKAVAAESDAGKKTAAQTRLDIAQNNAASQAELKPTPPNVTLRTEMTLHRSFQGSDREIQIRFIGRAHTGGDVIVTCPEKKS